MFRDPEPGKSCSNVSENDLFKRIFCMITKLTAVPAVDRDFESFQFIPQLALMAEAQSISHRSLKKISFSIQKANYLHMLTESQQLYIEQMITI
jgi:hypothetical protein